MKKLFIILVMLAFSLSAAEGSIAEGNWKQTSDFKATTIHACGMKVVAWDALRYATSVDGGVSWTAPISASDKGDVGVAQAVATPQNFLVLRSDGVITGKPGKFAGLVVDGAGVVFAQGINGHVFHLDNVAIDTKVEGTIYQALESGVIVQKGEGGLTRVTITDGKVQTQELELQAKSVPARMHLALHTGVGTSHWITKNGNLWRLKDGKVGAESRRAARFLSTWGGHGGYHELLQMQDQNEIKTQIIEEGRGGKRVNPRSRGIPDDVICATGTDKTFIALNKQGLWVVGQ